MFEAATEAALAGFGKEAPVSTPEPQAAPTTTSPSQQSSQAPEQPSIYDLDSAERFKWQGKEYTRESFNQELEQSRLRQADYTRKTQEIAEYRKQIEAEHSKEKEFRANISHDLEKVRENPALAVEFLKIYPKEYHSLVKHFLPEEFRGSVNQLDSQLLERMNQIESKLTAREQQAYEQEVKAHESTIDTIVSDLTKRYPAVDELSALVRMEAVLNQKKAENPNNPSVTLSKTDWENAYKAEQARLDKWADSRSTQKVTEIREAKSKAKDSAISNGAVAGKDPGGPRNFKEAREAMLRAMTQQ